MTIVVRFLFNTWVQVCLNLQEGGPGEGVPQYPGCPPKT